MRRFLLYEVFFFLSCLSLSALIDCFALDKPVLSLPSPSNLPQLDSPIPIERTAYVAIHYETGSYFDDISLTSVRVMLHTLRTSGIDKTRKILIIISPQTRERSKKLLQEEGFELIVSPFNHVDQCSMYFRKILLWQLTDYDRVVWIDNDVLVYNNMDGLFKCGRFCMVYSSLLHFTDAVFVIKPDESIFQSLYEKYQKLDFNGRGTPASHCLEESYHFFLRTFDVDMEAAPLFELTGGTSSIQHDSAVMRMTASVSLNAMMYYEFYTWRLMRGKEYRNMTDEKQLPALSLSYTTLKPYYWLSGLFFDLNWIWHQRRAELLHDQSTYHFFAFSATILLLSIYLFCTRISRQILLLYHSKGKRLTTVFAQPGVLLTRSISGFQASPQASPNPSTGTIQLANLNGDSQNDRLIVASSTSNSPNDSNSVTLSSTSNEEKAAGERLLQQAGPLMTSTTAATSQPSSSVDSSMCSLTGYWIPRYGVDLPGWILGIFISLTLGYVIYWCIPSLTPPSYAWPVFIAAHVIGLYTILNFIALAHTLRPLPQLVSSPSTPHLPASLSMGVFPALITTDDDTDVEIGDRIALQSTQQRNRSYSPRAARALSDLVEFQSSGQPRSLKLRFRVMWAVAFWEVATYVLMRGTFYPEFVIKMFAIFPLVFTCVLCQCNVTRHVLHLLWEHTQQGSARAKPTALNSTSEREAAALASVTGQSDGDSSRPTTSSLAPLLSFNEERASSVRRMNALGGIGEGGETDHEQGTA